MSGYTTDTTTEPYNSAVLYGYRSGDRMPDFKKPKNTCEKVFSFDDPTDYSVEFRRRTVSVRVPYTKNGTVHYRYKRMAVPYPVYKFVRKELTVHQWALIIKSLSEPLASARDSGFLLKEVARRARFIAKVIKPYANCRRIKYKDPSIQHTCEHVRSTMADGSHPVDISPERFVWNSSRSASTLRYPFVFYNYRFLEVAPLGYVGPRGENYAAYIPKIRDYRRRLGDSLIGKPIDTVFSAKTRAVLTTALWPDSNSLSRSDAKPLIDVAEAVVDGTIIGPPPSPAEAHQRMTRNALDDKTLDLLRESIDFSANLWLWSTLVVEPVIGSMVALSASVKMNDQAIEKLMSLAESQKWVKSKSWRFLKDRHTCFGFEPEVFASASTRTSSGYLHGYQSMRVETKVNEMEANAQLVYKIDFATSILANSSGVRLGSFFNRISTSFENVLYNLIPLSFVYDWFASTFSGHLNLKDKVFLPVAESKLIVSYLMEATVNQQSTTMARAHQYYIYQDNELIGSTYKLRDDSYWRRSRYYKVMSEDKIEFNEGSKETLRYYKRVVYDNPSRVSDLDNIPTIECFDNLRDNPLDADQFITLGALIWSNTLGH